MNESKVEVIFGHDCNVSTAYTTHADYRALEEERDALAEKCDEWRKMYHEAHSAKGRLTREISSVHAVVKGVKRWDFRGEMIEGLWIDADDLDEAMTATRAPKEQTK
jgi:hypothetical protein